MVEWTLSFRDTFCCFLRSISFLSFSIF
jgi:hypothetical protein